MFLSRTFVFVGIIQAWYHRPASFHFSFQHVYRKKNLYFPEYINNSQPESRKSSHGRSGERRAWNISRRIVSHRIGKDRRDKTFFEASKRRGLARRRGKNRRGGGGERRRAPARINVPADELLPRNGRCPVLRHGGGGGRYGVLDTLFTKHPTTPRFFAPSFFSPDAGKVRFAVQARCIKRWGGGGGCVEKKERDTVHPLQRHLYFAPKTTVCRVGRQIRKRLERFYRFYRRIFCIWRERFRRKARLVGIFFSLSDKVFQFFEVPDTFKYNLGDRSFRNFDWLIRLASNRATNRSSF